MKEYVSRQAVIEAMMKASTPAFDKNGKPTFLVDYVKTMECLPSTDVVEVVRCKDCIYKQSYQGSNVMWCGATLRADYYVSNDFFCANGERRESNE